MRLPRHLAPSRKGWYFSGGGGLKGESPAASSSSPFRPWATASMEPSSSSVNRSSTTVYPYSSKRILCSTVSTGKG